MYRILLPACRADAVRGCLVLAILIAGGVPPAAPADQVAVAPEGSDQSFWASATRALAHGRLDEAEALVRAQPVDAAAAAAIRARLALARGRLAEAEDLLTAVSIAAPTSEAALELGLLYARIGRKAESVGTLTPILRAARAFRQPNELLRAARAARSLGRFRRANQHFR